MPVGVAAARQVLFHLVEISADAERLTRAREHDDIDGGVAFDAAV